MRMIIEADDFRQLSRATQEELLEHFAGDEWVDRLSESQPEPAQAAKLVDLGVGQVGDLIAGLPMAHRRKLQLFAQRGGRVRVSDLLSATGDTDPGSISEFQRAVTQKLHMVLEDDATDVQLFGWDADATNTEQRRTDIVDGVYYISDTTACSLRTFFPCL